MDFAALRSAESGSVVLLEFSWPWPPDLEVEPQSCISYVVAKRAAGFLPARRGDAARPGQRNCGGSRPFPRAPGCRGLDASADWIVLESGDQVPAVVVDLPSGAASALARPHCVWRRPFCARGPESVPSRLRRAAANTGVGIGSTRRSKVWVPNRSGRRGPSPKAEGEAAQEQANLHELVRGIADQLAGLVWKAPVGSNTLAQGPTGGPSRAAAALQGGGANLEDPRP